MCGEGGGKDLLDRQIGVWDPAVQPVDFVEGDDERCFPLLQEANAFDRLRPAERSGGGAQGVVTRIRFSGVSG